MSRFETFVMKLSHILTMDLTRPWTAFEDSPLGMTSQAHQRAHANGYESSGDDHWSSSRDEDGLQAFQPMVNVDGSPMCGSVDIHGNPYGVTSNWNSHDTYDHSWSHDSWADNSWSNNDW